MYTIIYFSPTGNAKYLAENLAEGLNCNSTNLFPLEFTAPESLEQNIHLILLYPVHGFNAPRTVKRFVKNLPSGIFENVSLISVGCSDIWVNHAVSNDLKKVLKPKGFKIIVDEILAMPLTFIMAFPEKESLRLIAESESKIERICASIEKGIPTQREVKFKSHVINFIGKAESGAARLFGLELHANKDCISCGS